MSKWYAMMNIYVNDIPYRRAIEKLEKYLEGGKFYPVEKDPVLKEAISVIAFMPWKDVQETKARHISVRSLAAVVESLRRAGFGRAVVVGLEENDRALANEAFSLVHLKIKDPSMPTPGGIKRLGHMEVEFALGHVGHAKTTHHSMNIPRATLMGLRDAFRIAEQGNNDHESIVTMKTYLGDHPANYWKLIYLTEPDSILATRPTTLHAIKAYAEEGAVLIPWRLQPIPHEADVRGSLAAEKYLKEEGDFAEVLELDALGAEADKCCDEHKGPNHKPGLPPNFPECSNFWYMCGFEPGHESNPAAHERLRPYKLIKLKHGTQMVHLASTEHGRRCFPEKSVNGNVCEAAPN